MNYVFFTLLRATPAWLALTRQRRKELGDEHLGAALQARAGTLRMRYFDAEAFTALGSDLMMTETEDPKHHYFFMEQLRDSPLITHPYFEVVQIIPTVEDGYQAYEEALSRPLAS
jgi:hypothetical protein